MLKQFGRKVKPIRFSLCSSLILLGTLCVGQVELTSAAAAKIASQTLGAPDGGWTTVKVKSGDSTARIFHRLGLSQVQLQKILRTQAAKTSLSHLAIGEALRFQIINHRLMNIQCPYGRHGNGRHGNVILVQGQASQSPFTQRPQRPKLILANRRVTLHSHLPPSHQILMAKITPRSPIEETKILHKSITIYHSSWAFAAKQAGLTNQMIAELGGVFKHSPNLISRLRPGDHLDVLYKEYYSNNRKDHPGPLLLATLNSRGKSYQFIHYTAPSGKSSYYTPNGQSLDALFLPTPVQYKYISSFFSLRRYDPVLHRVHPHLGVDYAAPPGTPVHSIGDGEIVFLGNRGGFGNAAIIRYGNRYHALYAHMEHFASNLRLHQRVAKGEVIGYVGHTGWSTGDHLHFSWYVDGIARNPLTSIAANTAAIPLSYRRNFQRYTQTLLADLNSYQDQQQTTLAWNLGSQLSNSKTAT